MAHQRNPGLQFFYRFLKQRYPSPGCRKPLFHSTISHQNGLSSRHHPSSTLLRDSQTRISSSSSSSVVTSRTFSAFTQEISADTAEEKSENESTDSENGDFGTVDGELEVVESRKDSGNAANKKPLDVLFREAVGLSEKSEDSEDLDGNEPDEPRSKEIAELKKKLRSLEKEIRSLKGITNRPEKKSKCVEVKVGTAIEAIPAKSKSLYSLFSQPPPSNHGEWSALQPAGNRIKPKHPIDNVKWSALHPAGKGVKPVQPIDNSQKELAPELVSFVNRLYKDGYLEKANFLHHGNLHLGRLSSTYAAGFIRSTAEIFGQNHGEIAKWLSGSDLKKVALFGCPSVDRGTAFAAKKLRSFFNIQEDIVCRGCKLKDSCKFVNQTVPKQENLVLTDVMRVICVYGFNTVPQNLVISDEIKQSVNKLLKEVTNLSE